MDDQNNDGILLEAGTNEIEILELVLGTQYFGINVLKIKEIIRYDSSLITMIPGEKSHAVGTFIFKNECIPVIDLTVYFKKSEESGLKTRVLVVCEFNQHFIG